LFPQVGRGSFLKRLPFKHGVESWHCRGDMTNSTETTVDTGRELGRKVQWDFTFAYLVLRLWLGLRSLFIGIEKFSLYKSVAMPLIDPTTGQPDASGVMVNVNIKSYALANYAGIPASLRDKFAQEPLFPKFALVVFDKLLGPAFILTGIMLLVGLGTRLSLLAQALIYIALTVGLVLIDQPDGVAYLGIHIGLVAAALLLAQHNRFTVLKKW
jgi:thiosulfate dehydrogenase [quinone] large subunit